MPRWIERVGPIGLHVGKQRREPRHVRVDVAIDGFQAAYHAHYGARLRMAVQEARCSGANLIREAMAEGDKPA